MTKPLTKSKMRQVIEEATEALAKNRVAQIVSGWQGGMHYVTIYHGIEIVPTIRRLAKMGYEVDYAQ